MKSYRNGRDAFLGSRPKRRKSPVTVWLCVVLLGATVMPWGGRRALEQPRGALRASFADTAESTGKRRAALQAIYLEATLDIEAIKDAAASGDGRLRHDAETYLEHLRETLNR